MTNWRAIFGNALFVAAICVLLIELGEFGLLAYVWGFTTSAKVVSAFDNGIVWGVIIVSMVGTFVLSAASLISIHRKFVWPRCARSPSLRRSLAQANLLF